MGDNDIKTTTFPFGLMRGIHNIVESFKLTYNEGILILQFPKRGFLLKKEDIEGLKVS
jgi:hypothetical protein